MNDKSGFPPDWKTLRIEKMLDTPIFTVSGVYREEAEGKTGRFVRLDSPDWVTVIPVVSTPSGELRMKMVRQYRQGSGKISLEFPAGMVDAGETPEAAAIRELREETGLLAGRLELIGALNPNPAFMHNTTWTFLARELSGDGRQSLDPHENIVLEEYSERDVARMMGKDPMDNAIMVQAWFWYLRHHNRV